MQITPELIESLLFEEEGNELDFKRGQYPFVGAADTDKAKLLKDILAFVNAFRRSDAFILVGVDEVKGSRSAVVGVATQLDDASVQQFVNSKTQRPVTFSYRAATHDGLSVGIIHIPIQKRPVYLLKDYGGLKKDTVYLRRGSSTVTASPEEIAQMGAIEVRLQGAEPVMDVAFFDRKTGQPVGDRQRLNITVLRTPPKKEIPDYSESTGYLQLIDMGVNSNYYRELAEFTKAVYFYQPVSFAVRNAGSVVARDVRVMFEVSDPDGRYQFCDTYDMPDRPKARSHPLDMRMPASVLGSQELRMV